MKERAAVRSENFFRGTMRDPDMHAANDAAEMEALAVVKSNIEAHVHAQGGTLSAVQTDRALAVAQRLIRSLPRDQMHNIAANSGLLKAITDQTLAIAPVADPRTGPQMQTERGQGVAPSGDTTSLLGRRGMDGGGLSSFARSAEMGALSVETARAVEQARSEAMRLGMPWALNNPDLLRLGPSAIKTLHDAGVQRERFERMTGDKVGFRASTAVAIAGYAKRKNLTPDQTNSLFDKINNGAETISGGNRDVQRQLDEATRKFMSGPDTPEARRELEQSWQRHADTQEKREAANAAVKAIVKPAEIDAKATAQQAADVTQRDADAARRDEDRVVAGRKLDDLDAIAAAAPAAPNTTATKAAEAAPQPKAGDAKPEDKKAIAKAPAAAGPKPT